MTEFRQSNKLHNVCYDIRGPVLREANQMEEEGHRILKLNIGNPAPFGFDAPDEILQAVIHNLGASQGYSGANGIYSARKAIQQECQILGISVDIDHIFLGNGVSEMINLATQGLLNDGDEVLIPSPDYPLWTAAVRLAGGKPVHYRCDESNGWNPDLDDIRAKLTDKTRAIVIINPNNPTGAVYSPDILKGVVAIAEERQLVIFADEIYDKILYEDAVHTHMASLVKDTLCITFNGLSKAYRLAGFRAGWLYASGAVNHARNYLEGLQILTSMRLCANVPAQHAIQTALGGYQSIKDLTAPGGRLREQRDAAMERLNAIPGVSCVKPMGAIYLFPKLDPAMYPIKHDQQFVLELLRQEKLLVVQGTAFNWFEPDHLRLVFLPHKEVMVDALGRLERFLLNFRKGK
ncbi:MAG: pyridoxal phosphate-dependent aminotransferase [Gammaproteobacteria bacterium]|nr:MAG: pyridoxal phosphate-dependent aminotransferase [Gammaproteobacteria bacterium]